MFMHKSKKGFTIVELVIVIAVIAILAAVLIPTFSNLVKKANLSRDQQVIANMNKVLTTSDILDKFENPSDSVDALFANGWNMGKMEPYSKDYHYAYNSSDKKMYLLDENDAVIYPEAADKAKLWGFYYDSVAGKLDGVTNYIAMKNITNVPNFQQAFATGTYTIDLNGYFIDLGDGNGAANVTVLNGAFISGNVSKGDGAKTYEAIAVTDVKSGEVYENIVLTGFNGGATSGKDLPVGTSFKDCVIYDSSFMVKGSANFENCTFIGGPNNACIYIDNTSASDVINIKNCVFEGTVQRAINIAGDCTVNITGCVFNGTSTVEKHIIQIADVTAKVKIENCEFNALGTSPSIIRFNDGIKASFGAGLADNITFKNNKIASNIPVEKYVDTDGVTTDAAVALDNAMTNKMK